MIDALPPSIASPDRRARAAARRCTGRPAGARRPDVGLRLRLRAARHRRGSAARRVAAYAGANGLDPTAFPSLLAMENDLVGFARDLLDAPDTGGRHGHLRRHRVVPAGRADRPRRPARTSRAPTIVVADTVHAAFHKAAHYFGVAAVVVPVGADHPADADGDARPRSTSGTVLVVGSAPSYAHGVVDPIAALAAGRRGAGRALPRRRLHRRLGAAVRRAGWAASVPPWTFAVEGVTSISVDTAQVRLRPEGHVAAAAPRRRRCDGRSSSRSPTGRATRCSTPRCSRPSRAGRWPAPGRSSSRSGDEGYLALARTTFEAVDRIVAGVERDRPGVGCSTPRTRRW